MSPLNSEHLFKEETVVIASANLKSDLQLQTNQKALLRLQTRLQPGVQLNGLPDNRWFGTPRPNVCVSTIPALSKEPPGAGIPPGETSIPKSPGSWQA